MEKKVEGLYAVYITFKHPLKPLLRENNSIKSIAVFA